MCIYVRSYVHPYLSLYLFAHLYDILYVYPHILLYYTLSLYFIISDIAAANLAKKHTGSAAGTKPKHPVGQVRSLVCDMCHMWIYGEYILGTYWNMWEIPTIWGYSVDIMGLLRCISQY